MFPLHHFFVVAALSGAVFPLPVISSELEEYNQLKAAMVRSAAKKDHPLPQWIRARAREFEARPHYDLDSDRVQPVVDADQSGKKTSADKSR